MTGLAPRLLALATAVALLGTPALRAQQAANEKKNNDKPKETLASQKNAADSAAFLAKEAERREKDAARAANRALFAVTEPLSFKLIANYNSIAKDRDTLSKKRFAGTMVVKDSSGVERQIPVKLRTRGHFRLLSRNCRFVPLRVEFPDSGLKGTPFAGQKAIKLGTHCQNNDGRYDTYTRREYLAYTMFNAVSDKTFRARLAQGTYVDSASGKDVATDRVALFIESEDDVGRRLRADIQTMRGALFDDLDVDQLMNVSFYEYAIGNTDWSIYALHNVRLGIQANGVVLPLAYDFDFSGLVNAHYAVADPRMNLRSVRDRKFRGPCKSFDAFEAAAARFNAKKAEMLAAIAAVPGFDKREQDEARNYMKDFFDNVADPTRVRREIFDNCEKRPGM